MSHHFDSGFVVAKPAWHGLATVLENPPDAQEAIRRAGLDWGVYLDPVFQRRSGTDSTGTWENYQKVPDYFITVRTGDNKPLGIVGKRYTPVQNSQAFSFFDPFIQDGTATYHTAGSLKGGKLVWVLVKLRDEAEVAPGDPLHSYLLFSNSHDGSRCVDVQFTDVRVVCWNTLSAATYRAENGEEQRLRVPHTKSVHDTLEQIQGIVDARARTFEANLEQYRRLACTDIDIDDLRDYVRLVIRGAEIDDNKAVEEKVRGEDQIVDLFQHSESNNLRAIHGSWWAALNSVTEYIDHHRGKDQGNRVHSALVGAGAETKRRALELATTLSRG
jgi:phage/plasmid-like protein (TIGR03299 family)